MLWAPIVFSVIGVTASVYMPNRGVSQVHGHSAHDVLGHHDPFDPVHTGVRSLGSSRLGRGNVLRRSGSLTGETLLGRVDGHHDHVDPLHTGGLGSVGPLGSLGRRGLGRLGSLGQDSVLGRRCLRCTRRYERCTDRCERRSDRRGMGRGMRRGGGWGRGRGRLGGLGSSSVLNTDLQTQCDARCLTEYNGCRRLC